MKIVAELIVLTLSLLLVNADQYCDNFVQEYNTFKTRCSTDSITLTSCCGLRIFSPPSGIYRLRKEAFGTVDTYCDMNTTEGGWIVIQRNRQGSQVRFNRTWEDYENGFGDLSTEFWYGLKKLHSLTQRGQWEMRVDYQRTDGSQSHFHYTNFSVGGSCEEYPLHVGGFTGLGRRDPFVVHNGMKFSTEDNENDRANINCAVAHRSGWWYNRCHDINVNRQPPVYIYPNNALFAEMKIRPLNCIE